MKAIFIVAIIVVAIVAIFGLFGFVGTMVASPPCLSPTQSGCSAAVPVSSFVGWTLIIVAVIAALLFIFAIHQPVVLGIAVVLGLVGYVLLQNWIPIFGDAMMPVRLAGLL